MANKEENNLEIQTSKKKRKWVKRTLAIALPILLVILVGIYLFTPQPYYIEQPGSAMPLSQMVKVAGKSAPKDGDFYLTTVTVAPANNAMILASKLNEFTTVYSAKILTGGLNSKQYNLVNDYYMQTAQNTAVYQAFKLADKPYNLKYKGVYVLEVMKNSTFKDKLQIADTVTAVNGHTFESSKALRNYVAKQKVGAEVTIDFTRVTGEKKTATGKYVKLPDGKAGIGIGLTDHTSVSTNPEVNIDAGEIGGPSAGMMFTLEVYSQITGKNLLNGRKIAGTGTIEEDGSIGQIGGVDKKVVAASREGAEIFLVPDSGTKKDNNYLDAEKAAKRINTKMKIVPVKRIQNALYYLEKQAI